MIVQPGHHVRVHQHTLRTVALLPCHQAINERLMLPDRRIRIVDDVIHQVRDAVRI